MRIDTVRDQDETSLAPAERTDEYEVIAQQPLPSKFLSVHRTNGKYALIPAGIGLVLALFVYMAGLNYDFDMLSSVALGAVLVFGGFSLGNIRVRSLTESFQSHAAVKAAAEESGVSTKEIADLLSRFALRLEDKATAPIGSDMKLFVNLTESSDIECSTGVDREAQSFGLLRRVQSTPAE